MRNARFGLLLLAVGGCCRDGDDGVVAEEGSTEGVPRELGARSGREE
jgi:hypothetical protein